MVADAAAYWNSSPMKYRLVSGETPAPLWGNRMNPTWKVDPAVIRPVPRAPDHGLRIQHIAVDRHRAAVAHAGDTPDPLHAGGLEVALLGANQRCAVLDRRLLYLPSHRRIEGQHPPKREHHNRHQEPSFASFDAERNLRPDACQKATSDDRI